MQQRMSRSECKLRIPKEKIYGLVYDSDGHVLMLHYRQSTEETRGRIFLLGQ
jgi:hypothetical protein